MAGTSRKFWHLRAGSGSMNRMRLLCAGFGGLGPLLAVLLLWPASAVAQDPAALVATLSADARQTLSRAAGVVETLVRDVEPLRDETVLRCLRQVGGQVEALEATVATVQRGDPARALAALSVVRQEGVQLEQRARNCLRIESGEVLDYANLANGRQVDSAWPELEVEADPILSEPEPVDRPLSPVERP